MSMLTPAEQENLKSLMFDRLSKSKKMKDSYLAGSIVEEDKDDEQNRFNGY